MYVHFGAVVVHGEHVHMPPTQGEARCGERTHERLPFTRVHLNAEPGPRAC